jgi:ATP-dependent exoDNAse (exonuclease V) beta subunit
MGRPSKYRHGYPSVTQVVDIIDKPGLRYWYGKYGTRACEEKKRTSQSIGHGVHRGIERFLKGASFEEASESLDNNQKVMLSYLTEWCSKMQPKVILMEEPLYSHEHQFAGTPDLVCTLDKGRTLTIVDWKTDSVPRDKAEEGERSIKYLWQMSAYAIAYREMFKVSIRKACIVRASKDLQFAEYWYERKDLREGMKDFKMLREIFRKVKGK